MARAETLKQLFRTFKARDDESFLAAAHQIIDDERKKHHSLLANDLARILENGAQRPSRLAEFAPLPRDSDRGTELLEIRSPRRDFDDLVLNANQRQDLAEMVEEFRHWEILAANGLQPRHRLLFCGPPGCGKTAAAECLAAELRVPLLYVRFDSVVSSLLGETAANLRKVFDYASRGSWVVLFDEFDAVGRSRDDASEHGELRRVVNAFLQIMDGFTGRSVVIAATNFEQALDPALWRRFDEVLRFEKPTVEQIHVLASKRLAQMPHGAILKDEALASLEGLSHADVERLCFDMLRPAILAGRKSLSPADLERALQRLHRRTQALERCRPQSTGEAPHIDEE